MATLDIIKYDLYLKPFENNIINRIELAEKKELELTKGASLSDFANAHKYFGLHKNKADFIYRDWLPNAEKVYIIGDFSNWQALDEFELEKKENGIFQLIFSNKTLKHGDLYRIFVKWNGGEGDRIPAYSKRVVQDSESHIFNAQVWFPNKNYNFQNKIPKKHKAALIYEAHIGMASEKEGLGTYNEFTQNVLPKIAKLGYNTIQLMAIQEHPYYGSFGYHVSSFFAASSRFGTPYELKQLIDTAHGLGISVIMDLVHSHAVKNEVEGISKYDGSEYQYFHKGAKGYHTAWDSKCFDYGKNEVLHFLLSNCKFWIDEYKLDGFRFDGITSMLYLNHGLETDFTSYEMYFNQNIDKDAIVYLNLANKLIKEINPEAITIAEDMSGMPGLAMPCYKGGIGFDYRLAMGIPDFWIKLIKEVKDENWHVGEIFHRLIDKRKDEQTINYAESHDQALVGDKTIMFRLADKDMYYNMSLSTINITVERAIALHKIIRLITLSTSSNGYLNFMGNEFGHPEWIDFPREGNEWSYQFARRQWSLSENTDLAYSYLNEFDKDMVNFFSKNSIINVLDIENTIIKEYDQVLIFTRGKYVFVFNFNPFVSFTDYGFPVEKGAYEIILNTDNKKYLGYGRVDENITYNTVINQEQNKNCLKLYIPARSAFVMKKIN